jgi:hypothetical protein
MVMVVALSNQEAKLCVVFGVPACATSNFIPRRNGAELSILGLWPLYDTAAERQTI